MKDEKTIEVLKEEGNEFREGEEMKEVGEKEDLGRDDEFGAENEVREGEESGEHEEVEEIDRLSALPDELVTHILSFLGVERAAITSVLSKRWRFIWVELPNLELFDRHIHGGRTPQFVAWVDRIIALRSSKSLKNFDLDMTDGYSFVSNIDAWVEFAVKSKAKEVTLGMKSEEPFYTLPEMLYTSSTLTKLSLRGCIMVPERTIEWKSLVSLSILHMELPQHLLDRMLSACPLLSMFDLSQCWGFNCTRINSPSLLKLRVHDSTDREIGPVVEILAPHIHRLDIWLYTPGTNLRLTNIESVDKASIDLRYDWEGSVTSANAKRNAKELIVKTKHVKSLIVGHNCFDVLSLLAAEGWQLPQSRRVSLTVTVYPDDPHSLTGMIRLLESSRDLKTLVVHRYVLRVEDDFYELPQKLDDLNCNLLHLKTVTIETVAEPNLKGEPMLTLARILLKRATALEEMLLIIKVEDRNVFANISLAIHTYPRSSGEAVVRISH